MEKMKHLKDLLKHEVQDLTSAELQIIQALPKMIEKAQNPTLKKALQEHLQVTEEHKSRCEEVLEMLSEEAEENQQTGFLSGLFGGGDKVCKGMQGLIKEGEKIINADMNPQVVDAAIIACAQKIEHYEICGYGTVRAYANELGMSEVSNLLEKTLNEEYDADDLLTSLAVGGLNQEAEDGRSTRRNGSTRSRPTASNKGRTKSTSKKNAVASSVRTRNSSSKNKSSAKNRKTRTKSK